MQTLEMSKGAGQLEALNGAHPSWIALLPIDLDPTQRRHSLMLVYCA